MTPLLPSVSVGTIETRTVIESIRSLIGPSIQYIEAHCVDVDLKSKVITCDSAGGKFKTHSNTDQSVLISSDNHSGASSRVINDSC